MTDDEQRLCQFVHRYQALLDALYDLDLLPEQTLGNTREWLKTVRVVSLYAQASGFAAPWERRYTLRENVK